jgi:uncharacterized protein (TIGR03118 family)
LVLGLCTLAACLTACNGGSSSGGGTSETPSGASPQTQGFNVSMLVTGPQSVFTADTGLTDSNLSKPWDLAVGDGPIWVANAHTTVATVYDANGVTRNDPVAIPGSRGGSHVTGVVQTAGNTAFQVSTNGVTVPATYLFSTSSGTLAAWSAGSGFGRQAVTVYTDPAGSAEYTGLALLASGGSPFLFAADFANGRIDTFDSGFNKISPRGTFRDPALPAGYKPFNIQTLGDRLAVVYAKPREASGVLTITEGPGIGIVSLFDASGNFERRLITGGELNAPRGIALAPDNFGELGGKVLVANAGDGRINAFDRATGAFAGTMNDANGAAITLRGLSALAFRNGDRIGAGNSGSGDNTLFFTTGTARTAESAFGRIQPAPVQ